MIVYLIMFAFSMFFAYRYDLTQDSKYKRIIYCILSFLPFFLIAALRYNTGTDYNVYITFHIPEVLEENYRNIEFLYRYVMRAGVALSPDTWQMVFVITHLIIVGLIFMAFYKQCSQLKWAVMILFLSGFYNFSLNIMRQAIGMAIFIYALQFIVNKKPIHYILCILIAMQFHRTSIVYLPFYLVNYIKLDKRIIYALLALVLLFAKNIREILVNVGTYYGYGHYFNRDFDFQTTQSDFLLFNIAIILFMHIWIYIEKDKDAYYNNITFNLQALTLLACCMSSVVPNSTRIIYMFMPIQMITYANILGNCSEVLGTGTIISKLKRIPTLERKELIKVGIIGVSIALYIVFFIKLIVIRNIGSTIPYHFIFER